MDQATRMSDTRHADVPCHYIAFFDFECTGFEPFALGIQVVGFPKERTDLEAFERNISMNERLLVVADLSRIEDGVPSFEPSTKAWWLKDDQKAARDYLNKFPDTIGGYGRRPFHEHKPAIVRFITDIRSKYPRLRFATDNPTLDARYLDNIMDEARLPRISFGDKWQRVLAVDDLRDGFVMASGSPIPAEGRKSKLRSAAMELPIHAPNADVLHIAADYAELLVAQERSDQKRRAEQALLELAAKRTRQERQAMRFAAERRHMTESFQ